MNDKLAELEADQQELILARRAYSDIGVERGHLPALINHLKRSLLERDAEVLAAQQTIEELRAALGDTRKMLMAGGMPEALIPAGEPGSYVPARFAEDLADHIGILLSYDVVKKAPQDTLARARRAVNAFKAFVAQP